MELVSKSQFARITGLSTSYIGKLSDQEKITLVDDGKSKKPKVDLHGALTLDFLSSRDAQSSPVQPKNSKDTKPTSATATVIPRTESAKLKEVKLEEQIEELRIKNQQKRGNLVPKNIIVKVFNRIYNIDEAQFKGMGVNVSPKISAVYNESNNDKADEILKYFDESGTHPDKDHLIKLLNSGEPLRINDMNQILEDATGAILKGIQREITKFLNMIEGGLNGK